MQYKKMRLQSWCHGLLKDGYGRKKGSMARVVKIGPDSNGAVLNIDL